MLENKVVKRILNFLGFIYGTEYFDATKWQIKYIRHKRNKNLKLQYRSGYV